MRPRRALAACLPAMLGALALPSAGAADWSQPVTISAPGGENTFADLAIAPDGTVIVVWQRAECEGQGEMHQCENGRVQYSVRPPGGDFSAPVDMPGDPFAANSANPTVAVDGSGNAIAAWTSGAGESARIRYSLCPTGGVFGGAKTLADPAEGRHTFPDLAMAPDGRAVLALERNVAMAREAAYAVRPPGGDFDAVRSMAGDPGAGNPNRAPDVAIDDAGGAVAQWTSSGPEGEAIRYAQLDPGSSEFTATQTLDSGGRADLAMSPSGAAVMAWNPPGAVMDLRYAFRAPGAPFGEPLTLPEPDGPLSKQVAIAPDGSAVAAWTSLILGSSHPRWAAAPPAGPFGDPVSMPPGGKGSMNDLVMSPRGTALALWVATEEAPPFERHLPPMATRRRSGAGATRKSPTRTTSRYWRPCSTPRPSRRSTRRGPRSAASACGRAASGSPAGRPL